MNREADLATLFCEDIVKFADLVLRLRHGHSVTRNNDDALCVLQNGRRILRRSGTHRSRLHFARRARCYLSKGSEQDVGERPVHSLAHDDRKDEASRSVQRARDNQQSIVENETHRSCRNARVRVQQRDHGGHVGATDRNHQEDAKRQR
jgi:hypothetical protein